MKFERRLAESGLRMQRLSNAPVVKAEWYSRQIWIISGSWPWRRLWNRG